MKYKIANSETLFGLEAQVNQLIIEGYCLVGGVFVASYVNSKTGMLFCQSMTRG